MPDLTAQTEEKKKRKGTALLAVMDENCTSCAGSPVCELHCPVERDAAMAISFWDKQEDADAYNHRAYLDVLRILSKVVGGMPVVETFQVANSTSREIPASSLALK